MNRELPTVTATRYVQPLREGGSLPAVVDTDGDGLFVVKFRGAGQGVKVLVAEIIVGLLAEVLGLPVPELALVDVPPPFGRSEPDPEIQDILKRSLGINVGLRYLDGAFNLDPSATADLISESFATRLVWLDALITNPDRTPRNPNLLIWQRRPWLIDHGAALYAHHDWESVDEARIRTPFPLIRDHVLLDRTGDLEATDAELATLVNSDVIARILEQVPDTLLEGQSDSIAPAAARERYHAYLLARLAAPRAFVAEAVRARALLSRQPRRARLARR